MNIYILADLEGVSGLFRREQAWFWEASRATEEDRAQGRRLATDELNSAVRAALDCGADRIVARDCHHGGGNVFEDELIQDPRVRYVQKIEPWNPLPGIDESFAGLILLGHHAKAGTLDSFLPHTMNGPWADFRINGRSVGEIGIESCIAGHFGAAPILAQGDEALCAEARAMWPAIATAAVKRATTSDRCEGLSAEEGRKLTAERIAQAIQSLRDGAAPPPYRPSLPMMAELELRSSEEARRIAANRPLARLCGEKSLCAAVESHRDILRWIVGKPS